MKKLINIVLCLVLVLSMSICAKAATLDTTKLTIDNTSHTDKTVVTIPEESGAVLAALAAEGKTAKLSVPTVFTKDETVHVMKDQTTLVASSWNGDFVQFEVPGAGVYEILKGAAPIPEPEPSLGDQLDSDQTDIPLTGDQVLSDNHTVADGTVISADEHLIKSKTGTSTLTAEGSLRVKELNGTSEIILGTGDSICFSTDGTAVIRSAMDQNKDGAAVGYGKVQLTIVEKGVPTTKTYFLADRETITIQPDGTVRIPGTFAPGSANATVPEYTVQFEDQQNSYDPESAAEIVAQCNGLYDYFTSITIRLQDKTQETTLVAKANGKDTIYATGIQVVQGSTVLTLSESYLSTLPAGTHTITFHYVDGGSSFASIHIAEPKPTLEDYLEADSKNIQLAEDQMLSSNHSVASGTMISAEKHLIKSVTGLRTLIAEGSFTLKELNGTAEILLGAGDKITFSPDGTVVINAAMDKNQNGASIGYGKVYLTTVVNSNTVTQTYFLASGEFIKILPNGTISTSSSFAPTGVNAAIPVYSIQFADHDNTFASSNPHNIVVQCNGLYDYYTAISITLQGQTTSTPLAAKVGGKDTIYVTGIKVEEGSTILTMDKSFLKALPTGTHVVTFQYNDGGSVSAKIYVSNIISIPDISNPKTSDDLMIPVTTAFLCVSAFITLIFLRKKKYL